MFRQHCQQRKRAKRKAIPPPATAHHGTTETMRTGFDVEVCESVAREEIITCGKKHTSPGGGSTEHDAQVGPHVHYPDDHNSDNTPASHETNGGVVKMGEMDLPSVIQRG